LIDRDLMQTRSFRHRLVALVLGELVNKACVAAAFVWLARAVDQSVYGQVEWAVSVMMLFTLAADAGLSTWAAAQVAARPETAGALIGGVARLRLAMAVPAYAALLVVAALYGGRAGAALAVYGIGLFLTPLFLQYLYNGLHQVRWTAIGSAARGAMFAAIVLLFARANSTPMLAAIAEVVSAATMVLVHVIVLRTVVRVPVTFGGEPYRVLSLLRRSWTVSAAELTWGIHWYAGLILLGVLATPTDAAWQSAGLRLILAVHTGVWLYFTVLLPSLARLIATDVDAWRRLVGTSLRVTAWAGCGFALVGTLGARLVIDLVFGDRFGPGVPVFRAMVWVIPIAWMSGHIRYSLIAAEHSRKDYQAALVGAGTTVALTLLLLPALHSLGAGLALVGGTLANAIAALWLARPVLPAFPLRESLASSAAWCVAAVTLGLLLARFAGDVQATVAAGLIFGTAAIVSERETAKSLLQSFGGALLMKASSNADART
jgi:O-antigen/teichoic acid export membrane protein